MSFLLPIFSVSYLLFFLTLFRVSAYVLFSEIPCPSVANLLSFLLPVFSVSNFMSFLALFRVSASVLFSEIPCPSVAKMPFPLPVFSVAISSQANLNELV